jgi:hypothetical protein
MDVPEVRRRVRAAIDMARKAAQERRIRSDQAAADYEVFLRDTAVPVMQVFASALVAEGHRFKVFTPAGSVRLAADSNPDSYIELTLDAEIDPPAVIGRSNRGRGRRVVTTERSLNDQIAIAQLTEEDVLAYLVREIAPFVER